MNIRTVGNVCHLEATVAVRTRSSRVSNVGWVPPVTRI